MSTNTIKKLLESHAQGKSYIHAKAADMQKIYNKARESIMDEISRHALGHSDPYTGKYLVKLTESLQKAYAGLEEALRAEMKEAVPYVAQSYYFQALQELGEKNAFDLLGDIDKKRINYFLQDSYTHIAGRTTKLRDIEIKNLRDISQEVFRKTALTGATRAQVSRELLGQALSKSNFRFIDNAGHTWNNKTYFDMLGRTVLMNAGRSNYIDACVDRGNDVVRVTVSGNPCPACAVFENRLLSITGATPGLTTVDGARSMGLFHCNCTHSLTAVPASRLDQYDKEGIAKKGYKPPPLSHATDKEAWKKYRAEHSKGKEWSKAPIYKIDKDMEKSVINNQIPVLNPDAVNKVNEVIMNPAMQANGSYNMVSRISLSKETTGRTSNFLFKHRNGQLDKITLDELKGMKTLCHEINHSKHHPFGFSEKSYGRYVVELINEEHTLSNFSSYMNQLGFRTLPEWQDKLIRKGYSYRDIVKNSRDLAEKLGITDYREKVSGLAGLAGKDKPSGFGNIFLAKAKEKGYNKYISLKEILSGEGELHKWLDKQ